MRTAISWSDLRGASVGVWGLGIEGTANLQRLLDLGASVVVVEDSPPPGPVLGCEVLALAEGGFEELCRRQLVVKTPGVQRRRPEVHALEEMNIPVVGGLGLWMQEAPLDRLVAVTGTKGKSTTTAIAGHLLRSFGYRTLVGGNIGQVPYEPGAMADWEYAVVEVSSYQATDLAVSPPVVAVTSLHPDHLDWHGGIEAYYADKLSLCTQPGARLTVADGENEAIKARRSLLGPEVRYVLADDPQLGGPWLEALGLPGAHNRRNAMIARACLSAMGVPEVDDGDAMTAAAAGYEGLESRLRPIGLVEDVTFVDDSLSTNVLPTIAALDAFAGRRIALIVGGHDRGIDYEPLAEHLSRRPAGEVAVFTVPDNGRRIGEAVRAGGYTAPITINCDDLAGAVARAFDWARSGGDVASGETPAGGVVLLSPAAPSFGHFRNYRHRAAAFAEAMAECRARA